MKLSHVCLSVALVFFSNSVFSASTTLCSPGDYIFFGNGSTINTVDGTINNPYPLYVFTYKNTQLSPTPYYFGKPYDNYGSIPLFGYQDYTSSQTAYYAYVQNTATGQWYRYGVTTASGVLTPTSDMPLSSFHGSLSGPGASPQNVCTLALGTSVFQRTTQPAGATPPNAINRSITFINKTPHYGIQISETCAAFNPSTDPFNAQGNNPNSPFCMSGPVLQITGGTGSSTVFPDDLTEATVNAGLSSRNLPPLPTGGWTTQIAQQEFQQYGLVSGNFYVSAYQPVKNGPWIPTGYTGGYDASGGGVGTSYTVLFEFTIFPYLNYSGGQAQKITPNAPFTSVLPSNADVSAANGYNAAIASYPTKGYLCVQNNIAGNKYNSTNPLSALGTAGYDDMTTLCSAASGDPIIDYTGGQQHLGLNFNLAYSGNGLYGAGCLAPEGYIAELFGSSTSDLYNQYACSSNTPYDKPATCTAPPQTNYVKQVRLDTRHVYAYAYDDLVSDYGCDANASFIAEVTAIPGPTTTSTAQYTAPTMTVSNIVLTEPNAGVGTATVNWTPAQDQQSGGAFNYTMAVYPGGYPSDQAQPGSRTSITLPNLNFSNGNQYNVGLVSTDSNGSVTANALIKESFGGFYIGYSGATSPTQGVVSWQAGGSNITNAAIYYSFCKNGFNNCLSLPGTQTQYQLSGLTSDTFNAGTMQICDSDTKNCSNHINWAINTPKSACTITPVTDLVASNITHTGATLTWHPATDSSGTLTNYVITLSKNPDASGGQYLSNGTTSLQKVITGLSSGTTYYVNIITTDSNRCSAYMPSPISFTTMGGTVTLTPPVLSQQGASSPTGATVSWTPAVDSQGSATFNYTVNYNNQQVPVETATTAALTGLLPSQSYPVTVTATELTGPDVGNKITSTALTVTTAAETVSTPVVNPITTVTTTTAQVSWSASTSNLPVQNQINYTVSFNGQHVVVNGSTSTTLTGLTPSTSYSATVKGCDAVTNVCSAVSAAQTFTTSTPAESLTTPVLNTPTDITQTSAALNWTASVGGGSDTINYTLDVNGREMPIGAVTNYNLTGLTANTEYTVTVKGCDESTSVCSLASAPQVFTTLPASGGTPVLTVSPMRHTGSVITVMPANVACTGDPSIGCSGGSHPSALVSGYVVCPSGTGIHRPLVPADGGLTISLGTPMRSQSCDVYVTAVYDGTQVQGVYKNLAP